MAYPRGMPVPPIPPPFESLGQRPFSFYPPILNTEHNEWLFRQATWSEILVVNTKTGQELWVPRRFIGEVSSIEEPVMILGLLKELEYAAGQVLPHRRRVIEIPRAANEGVGPRYTTAPDVPPAPRGVVGIRLESGTESRIGRLIVAVLVAGVLLCFAVISAFRSGRDGSNIRYSPVVQNALDLGRTDDYFAVVRKLGHPNSDRWLSEKGELQYRLLEYKDQGFTVVLMGTDREKIFYLGAVDKNGRPVHTVSLPTGGDTASMLRSLKIR
ncbi:MAG TPA: hypothetical protein VE621_12915 [Bryobacteraceae bacterium]|nr:hypothetical protein [Bryobacteraceae bacterium]